MKPTLVNPQMERDPTKNYVDATITEDVPAKTLLERSANHAGSKDKPNQRSGPRYAEGDHCVPLNKQVATLIVEAIDYAVFLDEDSYVEWVIRVQTDYHEAYSAVVNRVAYLETISETHLADSDTPRQRKELREFRRLLGEGVARILDGESEEAIDILDSAEEILIDRSVQRARIWYLSAASTIGLVIALAGLLLWTWRREVAPSIGPTAFQVLLCATFGGAGALMSIILRVRAVSLNASAGRYLHYFEGGARMAVGVLGALFVAVAIKSNLLGGSILQNSGSSLALMATIGFVAGLSERYVPNLIRRIDTDGRDNSDDGVLIHSERGSQRAKRKHSHEGSKVATRQTNGDIVNDSGEPKTEESSRKSDQRVDGA